MSEYTTIEQTELRYSMMLDELLTGVVDRVSITMLGTLEIDVFDCRKSDLDELGYEVGVRSVERKFDGTIRIRSEKQVAPCIHGWE